MAVGVALDSAIAASRLGSCSRRAAKAGPVSGGVWRRVAADNTRWHPGFLTGSNAVGDGDPLRIEKRLIDRWLTREFAAPGI